MRRGERRRELHQHRHRRFFVELADRLEALRERLAFEQLHHDDEVLVGLSVVGDVDDVGVTNRVHRARLGEEPRDQPLVVRDGRIQNLQRSLAADERVLALEDDTEPTRSELSVDPIVEKRGVDHSVPGRSIRRATPRRASSAK
ncbi:MAG: hypothetical protein QM817_40240 [Archangium sp.]